MLQEEKRKRKSLNNYYSYLCNIFIKIKKKKKHEIQLILGYLISLPNILE